MLKIDDIFENRYKIRKITGQGGMGTVYLAEDILDNTFWAVKEERITEDNESLLTSEEEIMRKISFPAFPKLRCSLRADGYLYLIMEYIDGCTLEEKIGKTEGRLGESVIIDWFRQLCHALAYLHGLDTPIVYRDLKPSNIMLERSGRIRIIDLGIAQEYRNRGADVKVAALTRGYAAPEQYDSRYRLDVRTDIYALAVTIHYLLTGKDPNQPPYNFRPVRKLRHDASYALEYILKKCLQPNPDRRYADVVSLIKDLENIKSLEKELRSRRIWKRVLLLSSGALVMSASLIVYSFNLNTRKRQTENYYSYVERAKEADSLEEALKNLEEAVALSPDNPEAYIAYAAALARYGRVEEAVDYINNEIIVRFPDIYENSQFLILIQEMEEWK